MKEKTMVQIIVVNGMPGCGKTTFEEYCLKKLTPYADMLSTVTFVKEIAKKCGWDGEKTPKNRKFLSDLKDLLSEWNDVPFKKIEQRAIQLSDELAMFGLDKQEAYLFVDSREPEEIQRFCDELGAISVLVRRPAVENNQTSNHADANVFNYKYDFTIMNDGDIEKLYSTADEFIKIISEN